MEGDSTVTSPMLRLRRGNNNPLYFGDDIHGERVWKVDPVWNSEWKPDGIVLSHITPCSMKIKIIELNSFERRSKKNRDDDDNNDGDDDDDGIDDDEYHSDTDAESTENVEGQGKEGKKRVLIPCGYEKMVRDAHIDACRCADAGSRAAPGWIHVQFLDWIDKEDASSIQLRIVFGAPTEEDKLDRKSDPAIEGSGVGSCFCRRNTPVSSIPKIYSPLLTGFEKLYLSSYMSDFTIEVSGEEIHAHKNILGARVPFFEALFDSGMTESRTNRIEIKGFDAATVKALLKVIYCAKLPEDLDENCHTYLAIADLYQFNELKNVCFAVLERNLRRENVVDTLMLADHHQRDELKDDCLRLFHDWKDSMSHQQLEPLKSVPALMFECLTRRKDA